MTFQSVLFQRPEDRPSEPARAIPDFFVDLNLDRVVDAVTAGREEYRLQSFFLSPLKSIDAINYRQEVMRELEDAGVRGAIIAFADRMRAMREYAGMSSRILNQLVKDGWFLCAAEEYSEAVEGLERGLAALAPKSRGLSAFLEHLKSYVRSEAFISLVAETKKVRGDLRAAKYTLRIKGNQLTVSKYDGEADYRPEVERTFERFKRGAAKDHRAKFAEYADVNHVEEAALDFVARLYPEAFQRLRDYCARRAGYLDKTVADFDREIQFYLAFLETVSSLRAAGLEFCYPEVSQSKEVSSQQSFDMALAIKLVREKAPVVRNDFYLKGGERIFIVSGPNQGGKTTFARAFAQLHYLASLGLPVPGKEARLLLSDRAFTHFEREEDINDLKSKLEADIVRIRAILDESTSNSILIINELFTSSALPDAIFLGRRVLEKVIELDALCIYVTFLEELSSMPKTVSAMSSVDPHHPGQRTYKISRRPAGGLVHAESVAEKYQLSYERIKERIRS